jgi:uncharacterized protein (TIGR02391 family)
MRRAAVPIGWRQHSPREVFTPTFCYSAVQSYCRKIISTQFLKLRKALQAKVRTLSGLDGDGADLIQRAFGFSKDSKPVLAINTLASETDKGEQRGFVSLLVGVFGTVRNPLAHNAKVEWQMMEQDALDILTLVSLIHRKLDRAI